MSIRECLIKYCAAAAAFLLAGGTVAQIGVTADKILIGQSAGFTGSVAGSVKEQTAGAKAYFDVVNARGDVDVRTAAQISFSGARQLPLRDFQGRRPAG